MKIVHLIEYFSPAFGYQETYLAKEQQALGHEVVVLTSDRYFPFPNYEATVKERLGERIVGVGQRKEFGIKVIRNKAIFEIFSRVWIKDLIPTLKALKPDAIHVHSISSLSTLRLAISKDLESTVIVADDHSHLSVVSGSFVKEVFYWFYRSFFSRLVSRRINHFVAITPETRKIVRDFIGITDDVEIIELGADTKLFKTDSSKGKKIRTSLGFNERDVVFIYTGKLIADKGIHVLIDAFVSMPSGYKLLLVGSGPKEYVEPLKRKIEQLNKESSVVWVSAVSPEELPGYYNAADVGVWPKQESISMLEAASCGLPVIVKNSPSMSDRIRAGNGLMYKEGDVKELVLAMKRLGSSKKLRLEMGRKGAQLIRENYSWTEISKKFIELYRKKRI